MKLGLSLIFVSDRKALNKEIDSDLDCSATLAEASYKICFDCMKITTGFGKQLGEVDLFGYESSPTKRQREE